MLSFLSSQARVQAAGDVDAAVEVLELLSWDADPFVLSAVAANDRTPPATLRRLATDPDLHVRSAVAENPHSDMDVAIVLADDPAWQVRASVARREDVPVGLRAALSEDPHPAVVQMAGNAPKQQRRPTLAVLGDDDDPAS